MRFRVNPFLLSKLHREESKCGWIQTVPGLVNDLYLMELATSIHSSHATRICCKEGISPCWVKKDLSLRYERHPSSKRKPPGMQSNYSIGRTQIWLIQRSAICEKRSLPHGATLRAAPAQGQVITMQPPCSVGTAQGRSTQTVTVTK